MDKPDEDELVRRAFSAYFHLHQPGQPIPANTSRVEYVNQKAYVVLDNVNGILAVYRVRTDGKLKHLKRWPAELAA